ncbi:unnamed protein product [Phytophthora lilii]|uniref:Unnamed protein product n=1 Tax=Phytophthora lilii TaxID=2077276 RepID=A0A9W6TIA7_9STRA|nr:unnamed protein product [Phytophthora lilii]
MQLLRQIYVTKLVEPSTEQVSNEEEREQETYPEQELRTSRVLDERRRAPKVTDLEARGWRFAQVTLATVDEQYLFEFEVKLQLRTETQDLVAACATFRNELLRNFPAEVFLQRPAVIQHLLHLVQQPVLPGSPSSGTEQRGDTDDALMERAMEVSMGVNYFDEMLNSTFSNKRGNLSGAVVMASLKAIESFLYALKRTRRICLDPTYVVHTPNVHVELFDSYDTRRVQYPRQSAEVGNDDGRLPRQRNSSADQLEQFSLSGAVYKIFMSILPLLRSARHPRLHLLNLLITALPDLPENGYPFLPETNVAELNNLRLENIFVLLSGICRPGVSEQVDNTMVDADLDFTDSMTWKLVELVLRLFKLYPPSQYYVEEISSKANTIETSRRTETSDYILIPRSLWEVVKLWVSNPAFFRVASNEWNDKSLVKNLPKIDETIPTFISLKHSSQQDARHIFAFVAFAKTHQEQIAGFGLSEKPAILSLEVAQKTIQTRSAFNNMDAEFIADATIQTIWFVLIANGNDETERIAEKYIEVMQFILCDLLSGSSDTTALVSRDSMVVHFLRRLMDLVDRFPNEFSSASIVRGRQFITEVICEPKFLSLLLLVLAEQDRDSNDHTESAAFWGILRFALIQFTGTSSDRLELLQSVVPLLQHFAYIEPSNKTTQEQRLAQPQLAEVLNRFEATTPDCQRYVLMCRCLLHNSSYIRKAAASGILQLLSRVSPSCIEWITKDKEIRDDPFGGTFFRDGKSLTLERELMESPLPVAHTSNYQPSENELSSQLTKLSHLCTVISGTSAGFGSIREAALKELVMFIENASVELLNLFEELDKLSNLMDLLCGILQADGVQKESSTIEQALLLFRTLLLRSRLLRSAMQNDTTVMELLMPLIFYPTPSIRTQVYYIVLLLTCSAENFVPTGAPADLLSKDRLGEASIPEMIKSTFGLHSSRWSRCFIVFCSLKQQLQVSRTLLMKRVDPNWMQEVKTLINQAPFQDELTNHGEHRDQFPSSLVAEYTYIVSRIRDAPSHGKCLNAVYHLMTVCEAWGFARRRFVEEWEADFERYFAVPPKSERDEVIISSLVCTLSVMFHAMTRKEQLRALVVVKRKILPLLKRSQSKVFSLQIARLLLNVSESHVDDLFVSLAADTDIIATICTKYSAVYAVEPVLHAVMLQVLLRFARGIAENSATRVSIPWREKICKRLLEMLSPLLSVVCHHRVPGTFLERDIFVVGSQCLVAILQTLSRESLLSTDSPLEHSDSNILIEGSWASRFLFDHVSPIRELGFLVIEHIAFMDPPSSRLLEMVFETYTDDTESDAVRAAACNVITKEILRFHDSHGDQQAAMVEIFHGITFSGRALRSLTNALKTRKLFPRSASAFAQLVRVLYIQNDRLAPRFGDLLREMELAEEEFDFYPLLVQVSTHAACVVLLVTNVHAFLMIRHCHCASGKTNAINTLRAACSFHVAIATRGDYRCFLPF